MMQGSMSLTILRANQQWDERKLVCQLCLKNQDALSMAFKIYSPAMMSVARTLLDHASAEDIVQDSWVTAMTAIQSYEGRASLKTWLCQIVRNKALNYKRSYWRESTMAPDLASNLTTTPLIGRWGSSDRPCEKQPDQDVVTMELKDRLDIELNRMSKKSADVVRFRLKGGLNDKEISEIMGITQGHLRVLLHRAKSRLKAAF